MNFTIEAGQKEDGRWLSEVLELPGVLVYGLARKDDYFVCKISYILV